MKSRSVYSEPIIIIVRININELVFQVEAVASSLDDAGVRKRTTRIALTKVISRGLRAAPDVERLKK